jgi:hypothetical protein
LLTRVQNVEIGDAIDAEHHGRAVVRDAAVRLFERGVDEQDIAGAFPGNWQATAELQLPLGATKLPLPRDQPC